MWGEEELVGCWWWGVVGGGSLGMTMHDEQPAIWSASAGASL